MAEFAHLVDEPGVREGLRASDFVPTDEEIARIEREVRDEPMLRRARACPARWPGVTRPALAVMILRAEAASTPR